jgi:D-aspartate ligase
LETIDREFVPVLLGNDINTYSMARAFYEAYKIKTIVMGKADTGPSCNSRIIDYYAHKYLDQQATFIETINTLAQSMVHKKIILIGCGDSYVELIIKNKEILNDNIIVPYIDEGLMNDLITKESFYHMCDKYGLDYPQTFIYERITGDNFVLPFDFPVILKPSSGIKYWEHEFTAQKKVYKIDNLTNLKQVINQIYASGYDDKLIIQEFIPGDDSYMRVMTCFSGQDYKVKLMSMGHVMLEEHTPHGLGNTSVIMNDYNEEFSGQIRNFLDNIGYTGLSNFDTKFDKRDGKIKVFEINVRQGRNNYYVTGAGYNLAKYLVEEYIYNKATNFEIVKTEHLWTVIPIQVAFKYVKESKYTDKMKQLISAGKVVNPLFLKGDTSFKRLLYLYKSHFSHFIKYKKYYA